MALLVVTEPQPIVTVIVREIINTMTMLLVLEPLAFILLTISKGIDAISLTTPLVVFAFICITVLIEHLAFAVGLTGNDLTIVLAAVFRLRRAKGNLLCSSRQREHHSK